MQWIIKKKAKERKQIQKNLENNLKNLENLNLNLDQNDEYIGMKRDLEAIFDAKVEGSRIRSKCTEYEFWENLANIF